MPKLNADAPKPLPSTLPNRSRGMPRNEVGGGNRRFWGGKRQEKEIARENAKEVRRAWLGAFFRAAIVTAPLADQYANTSTRTLPHSGPSGHQRTHSNQSALALPNSDSHRPPGLNAVDAYAASQGLQRENSSSTTAVSSTAAVTAAQPSNNAWHALVSRAISSVQSSFSNFLSLPVAEAAAPKLTLSEQQLGVDLSGDFAARIQRLAERKVAYEQLRHGYELMKSGDHQKAIGTQENPGLFRQVINLFKELHEEKPEDTTMSEGLAVAYTALGFALNQLGQYQEAVGTQENPGPLRQAVALFEQLHDAKPEDTEISKVLANANSQLGFALEFLAGVTFGEKVASVVVDVVGLIGIVRAGIIGTRYWRRSSDKTPALLKEVDAILKSSSSTSAATKAATLLGKTAQPGPLRQLISLHPNGLPDVLQLTRQLALAELFWNTGEPPAEPSEADRAACGACFTPAETSALNLYFRIKNNKVQEEDDRQLKTLCQENSDLKLPVLTNTLEVARDQATPTETDFRPTTPATSFSTLLEGWAHPLHQAAITKWVDAKANQMAQSLGKEVLQSLQSLDPRQKTRGTQTDLLGAKTYFQEWINGEIKQNIVPTADAMQKQITILKQACEEGSAHPDIQKVYNTVAQEKVAEIQRNEKAAKELAIKSQVKEIQEKIFTQIGMLGKLPSLWPDRQIKDHKSFQTAVSTRIEELTKELLNQEKPASHLDVLTQLLTTKFSFGGKASLSLQQHMDGELPHCAWYSLGQRDAAGPPSVPRAVEEQVQPQTLPPQARAATASGEGGSRRHYTDWLPTRTSSPEETAKSPAPQPKSGAVRQPAKTSGGSSTVGHTASRPPPKATTREQVPFGNSPKDGNPSGIPAKTSTVSASSGPSTNKSPVVLEKAKASKLLSRTKRPLEVAQMLLPPESKQMSWGENQLGAVNAVMVNLLQLSAILEKSGQGAPDFINHFKSNEFVLDLLSWALDPQAELAVEQVRALREGVEIVLAALTNEDFEAICTALAQGKLTACNPRDDVTPQTVEALLSKLAEQFGATQHSDKRVSAKTLLTSQQVLIALCVGQLGQEPLKASQTDPRVQEAIATMRGYRNEYAHNPFLERNNEGLRQEVNIFLEGFKGQAPQTPPQGTSPLSGNDQPALPSTGPTPFAGLARQVQQAFEKLEVKPGARSRSLGARVTGLGPR